MICPKCGSQVVDGAQICPNCGTVLNQTQQPMNNPNKKKKSILVPIILVVIIALIVFGVTKIMKKETPKENKEETNNDSTNTGTKDSNVTKTTFDENGDFLMALGDVYVVTNKGTYVSGSVLRGTVKLNDEVQIIGMDREVKNAVVKEIGSQEKGTVGKRLDTAKVGDKVELWLDGISRDDVERGQVVAKPNSIKAGKKFEADFYILSKEEGGRKTPFFENYKPDFYFGSNDITGSIKLPETIEMVMPGDSLKMTIELEYSVALDVGMEVTIHENGLTVGRGTITKVD